MEWLRNSLGALFSKAPSKPDGRPKLSKIEKKSALKTKRRKTFTLDNPHVVELNNRISEYRQKNPYGVCRVCNKNTHNTEDHDAVMRLIRQKAQSKRQRTIATVGRRGNKWTMKRRPPPQRKPIEISPFICLDEHMQSRYRFDEVMFDEAWTLVTHCINEAPYADLFNAISRTGQYVMEDDGTNRVYRDDWQDCCPDEVKQIAREMAQKFLDNGVITLYVLSKGSVHLYCTICYAVIRLYLDHLEWEDVHRTTEFEECLMEHAHIDVIHTGRRLVSAIVSNKMICDRMQLGEYSGRIVDAVRYEGEGEGEGEDEGEV
jgi:hypothetical protein